MLTNESDDDKVPVIEDASKDVLALVYRPGVERIEDLTKDESVENKGVELGLPLLNLGVRVGGLGISENGIAREVE